VIAGLLNMILFLPKFLSLGSGIALREPHEGPRTMTI